jgi:hypothetical protein
VGTLEERSVNAAEAAARAERLAPFAEPIFLVPTAEDRALGYHFVAADEDQLETRKSRTLRNKARKAGWYVVTSQLLVLCIEKSGREPELVRSIGVHACSEWPPVDGSIGLVAWWRNGEFDWGCRYDFAGGRYTRARVGGTSLSKVINERTGNHVD